MSQLTASWKSCVCAQSHLTLYHPMDCSLPGSPVHRIFQTRILEWVAMSSCKGPSSPGITPLVPAFPTLQVDSLPLCHQRGPYPWNNEGKTPVTRRSVRTSNTSEEEGWHGKELGVDGTLSSLTSACLFFKRLSWLNSIFLTFLPEPEFTDFFTILHYFLNQHYIHASLCAC